MTENLSGLIYANTAYTYTNPSWPDQAFVIGSDSFTYDSIGNSTVISGSGRRISLVWSGRSLISMTSSPTISGASGTQNISYTYDAGGIRTSKTLDTKTTYFTLSGDNVLKQSDGTNTIWFLYAGDSVIGLIYNGTSYYYYKNLQGDVIGIVSEAGTIVTNYVYDTWGKVISVTGSLKDTVGKINPIRYRSYYYDIETGLYYLNSRYYNPTYRRFLNADGLTNSPGSYYAYCLNDPVNSTDPDGDMPNWLKWTIGIGLFAAAIGLTLYTGGSILPVIGWMATSIVVGGVMGGLGSLRENGNFFGQSFFDGLAEGALAGGIAAFIGASIGALDYTLSFKGAVRGTKHLTTILKGTKLDRYGSLSGQYVTKAGTAIEKLALPPTNTGIKTTLQVAKNIRAYTSLINEGFGGTGGGVQYFFRYSIEFMLKKGMLIII